MEAADVVSRLEDRLGKLGLDVVAPLQLKWYNDAIPHELGARIKPLGAPNCLVVLVGNSKLIWEPFLEACSKDDSLLGADNPFDVYVQAAVEGSLQDCAARLPYRIYWSHKRCDDLDGDSHFVAMQRMADAVGLAYLDHASHLCLHPKYGSWFSLRCAVVFDGLAYEAPKPRRLHNPMCHTTRHYVKLAIDTAIHCAERRCQRASLEMQRSSMEMRRRSLEAQRNSASSSGGAGLAGGLHRSGDSSSAGGTAPTAAALLATGMSPRAGHEEEGSGGCCFTSSPRAGAEGTSSACTSRRASKESDWGEAEEEDGFGFAVHDAHVAEPPPKPTMEAVRSTWRKWVAVRDAPCPGHPWRYSEEQLTYHYTADREVLLQVLARRRLAPTTPDVLARGLPPPPAMAELVLLA